MITLTTTADAQADPDRAWAALADVESWPQWTASVTSAKRLDEGPLRVGSKARIKQPGLLPLVWEVSEIREGEAFRWSTGNAASRTVGVHRLAANSDGTTQITLELEQSGAIGSLIGALMKGRFKRFLELEVAGLKAASESR